MHHGEKTCLHPHTETKYVVFESKLLQLLNLCPKCGCVDVRVSKKEVGTLVAYKRGCSTCDAKLPTWESQPYNGSIAADNLLLSASILFSGGSCSQTLRILQFLRVPTITERTFYRHQKSFGTSNSKAMEVTPRPFHNAAGGRWLTVNHWWGWSS